MGWRTVRKLVSIEPDGTHDIYEIEAKSNAYRVGAQTKEVVRT
jgi:hypothetical protein